jgi:murein DD-endopeptidase MepM/ murein hydrolase activator NlpD
MSANFVELGAGHFHSGIDLRVEGALGAKVYAIKSGYVSRIYVSSTGYGKALYIEYPDGHTSVSHLGGFAGKIANCVEEYHYRRQRFHVNDYTDATLLPVKKGDVIDYYVENTGSSFGAHLHFEIRESAIQAPINPVAKGYITPNDNVPSVFHRVTIFTLDSINDITRPRLLKSERMVKRPKGFVPEKTACVMR